MCVEPEQTVSRVSVESGRAKDRQPRALRVERDGALTYAETVKVGRGVFVTNLDEPRPYGAYVWFETTEPVIVCSSVHETRPVEED